ncbi:MAG TPA: type II toxin-antitoxin system VapC family toxin [Chloroflexota bacterium]|nr:type II toxin-antitoxin system VapC family toxin [Chloroflexota bacterium]
MPQRYVVDASALLALLNQEPGAERVARAISAGSFVSAVNFSEVVARLSDAGMPEPAVREALDTLELNVVAFDRALGYRAGFLRPSTKRAGLSLGDRACLALAQHDNLPALTADRAWRQVATGTRVEIIR